MIGIGMGPSSMVPSKVAGTLSIVNPSGNKVNASRPPDRLVTPAEALGNVRPPGKNVNASLPPDKPTVTGVCAGMVKPSGNRVNGVLAKVKDRNAGSLTVTPPTPKILITMPSPSVSDRTLVCRLCMSTSGWLNRSGPISASMLPVSGSRRVMGAMVFAARSTDPWASTGIAGMVIGGMVKGPRPTDALVMSKRRAGTGTGATCRGPAPPLACMVMGNWEIVGPK